MASVAATRDRVQGMLTDLLGTVEIDSEGDFTFRNESARLFLRVVPWGEGESVLSIRAFTNMGVPSSPELFRFVAMHDKYVFGHLSATEEDGEVTVSFDETLLGDFLDPKELETAVFAIALGANDVDDEIKSRFGGRTFH